MTTKEKLLKLFESNKGIYFSGEEIAQKLCISRAAVWKAVKSLRTQGYSIDAVTNKGYCLSVKTDILSPQGIQKYLNNPDLDIHVFQTVKSTNALVREKAAGGVPEGYVAVANQQTEGKGRSGRQFFSPDRTGAYWSILLRPVCCAASQAVSITTMAAAAMCRAIEAVSDEKPQIKWVNDIYIKGRKVCGILTEGSFHLESNALEYAVLGVGLNVYPPENGFPEELKQIAGAVFDQPRDDMKNRLVAAFINEFFNYYRSGNQTEYMKKYRKYSMVIGKEVTVMSAGVDRQAIARGIDDQGRLLVEYENGKREKLSYGEIKIRL